MTLLKFKFNMKTCTYEPTYEARGSITSGSFHSLLQLHLWVNLEAYDHLSDFNIQTKALLVRMRLSQLMQVHFLCNICFVDFFSYLQKPFILLLWHLLFIYYLLTFYEKESPYLNLLFFSLFFWGGRKGLFSSYPLGHNNPYQNPSNI